MASGRSLHTPASASCQRLSRVPFALFASPRGSEALQLRVSGQREIRILIVLMRIRIKLVRDPAVYEKFSDLATRCSMKRSVWTYRFNTSTKRAARSVRDFQLCHVVLFHILEQPRSHALGHGIGGHARLDIVEKMGEELDVASLLREGRGAKPLEAFLSIRTV